ncbi:MAG: fumarate hydratase [Desulfosarcinaceae bacterium]|nr:fumarate hydratase [Desulfosarcinaceae bacterium]
MADFAYQELLPIEKEDTAYRLLTRDHVATTEFEGTPVLKVDSAGLTLLAEQAFQDVSHLLRTRHLEQLAAILDDPEATDNDRYVALEMLKNAVISAEMEYPMCQDTGTAIIMGKKGQQVWTGGGSGLSDEAALSRGVFNAYTRRNLRYSQNAPLTLYEEQNTGCNLPAQVELYATAGDAYRFLFIAKGGGSANKTYLFQETKAVLNPDTLVDFLTAKMKTLGTAACPPYHLAFVIGGTSAEYNLKTVKLASAGYLDHLPTSGNDHGRGFRDLALEAELHRRARELGLGAQFGGVAFCHDVRVVRLPRHGASCPIGMGVSCSADRNIKAKITAEGIFLEALDTDPARFLPTPSADEGQAVHIDLNQSMDAIRAELSRYPVATRLLLSGKIIVGRDIAHAKLKERLDRGEGLPQYLKDHIIYYAGPAKTPDGRASGAFGPTTAGRMDPYVPLFQAEGASMVMLAKGNRSALVTDSCKRHGGFYLGSIGGPAARLGRDCITEVEVLEYPELGMEAIYQITVVDFPAFILVDDKGNDFFAKLL